MYISQMARKLAVQKIRETRSVNRIGAYCEFGWYWDPYTGQCCDAHEQPHPWAVYRKNVLEEMQRKLNALRAERIEMAWRELPFGSDAYIRRQAKWKAITGQDFLPPF